MRDALLQAGTCLALLFPAACDRGHEAERGGLTVLNPVEGRPFFDFGQVPYGSTVEHVFEIRNDEANPVRIRELMPSCGCATPRIHYVAADGSRVEGTSGTDGAVIVLPPGAVAQLLVRVDTTQVQTMNIDKLATVRIRSDSATRPFLTVEMHLLVVRTMQAVPGSIELGQSPRSSGRSGRSDVTCALPGKSVRVRGIEKIEGPFTATVDATEISGVPVWIVVATVANDLPIGPARGKVILATTKEDGTGEGASFEISVSAQIAPDVVLRPPVLAFGTIAKGTAARVVGDLVALVPGERFHVTATEVTTEPQGAAQWIASEATPVDPDDEGSSSSWTIVLQSWPKLEEPLFSGTLVLRTDHPKAAEIRVPFSGAVR